MRNRKHGICYICTAVTVTQVCVQCFGIGRRDGMRKGEIHLQIVSLSSYWGTTELFWEKEFLFFFFLETRYLQRCLFHVESSPRLHPHYWKLRDEESNTQLVFHVLHIQGRTRSLITLLRDGKGLTSSLLPYWCPLVYLASVRTFFGLGK